MSNTEDNKKIPQPQPDKTAEFHPSSTTQGGSNHGQGSSSLDINAIGQGAELDKGSNYENENGDIEQ
ncbi:MAG: hypothetical protein H7257_05650 [Taibaiella sp.]|nr:hypothetical protein [Taibaiella sp.]